ncbi:hypothetical protein D623_10008654 [Myotis brandtii]|uniref:Uncharacterized protein n=1 Tax=Myotis brandtii TaxID=109478 RepID=S7Q3B8_MYOBR|nr:hypothetical protein D623_10008654 [Myotis brandtii]
MHTPRGSLIPREVETPKELQLRVTPVEVKFQDTMAGKVYRQSITVHNVGRSNQKIRFLEPAKPQFKLVLPSMDKEIASGLQMTAMVEYHPNKNEDISDQLFIAVGNKAVEVPLIGLIPACQLEMKPDVDFGTLVANSKVYSKEVKIINRGKAPGMFTTKYQGQLPIVVSPSDGIVEPKSSKIIKVDFCADQPSLVNEVAMVITEGKKDYDPSHRQDYAVFVRFDSVGSKDGFLRDDNSKTIKNDQFQKLELALTGSGLPVIMQFNSGSFLTFPTCSFGESSEISFIMKNRSKLLPVMYHFRKTANFRVKPERGNIDAGCIQEVTCSFMPHQVGAFTVKQYIDFIGPVADKNFQSLLLRPFYHIHLVFKGACKISNKKVVFQINPGISPIATNPTGQFVVKDLTKYKECAPVAMLQSALTTIHNHKSSKESVQDALIAFPNDRTASIRPGDQEKHFRTIFTKVPRHNYVDTEFTYTDSEVLKKKAHEDYYKNYIDSLRKARLQKKAGKRGHVQNMVGIGHSRMVEQGEPLVVTENSLLWHATVLPGAHTCCWRWPRLHLLLAPIAQCHQWVREAAAGPDIPSGLLHLSLLPAASHTRCRQWPRLHPLLVLEPLLALTASAGPAHTRSLCRSCGLHPLLAPSTSPDHSAPSAGVSSRPLSPLRASPPPPVPEGRSGQQLLLAPADGSGPASTCCWRQPKLLLTISRCKRGWCCQCVGAAAGLPADGARGHSGRGWVGAWRMG